MSKLFSLEPSAETLPQRTTIPKNTECTILKIYWVTILTPHDLQPTLEHVGSCVIPVCCDTASVALLLPKQQDHLKCWALWCSRSTYGGVNPSQHFLCIWFAVYFALCFGTCGSVLLCLPVFFFCFLADRCCSNLTLEAKNAYEPSVKK